ncbi:hypothetical protein D9M71_576970 [compost metagenome]
MPRPKKPDAEPVLQIIEDLRIDVGPELKYSDADMQKLDQFAIGLLRDGTGSYDATDTAFVNRVRAAYLRAEVMLTIRKEIAALEA